MMMQLHKFEQELETAADLMAARGQAGRYPARRLASYLRQQGFLPTQHFLDRLRERAQARGIRFDPRLFRQEFYRAQHYRQIRPGYHTRIAVMRGLPILYRMGGENMNRVVLVGVLPEGGLPPVTPVASPILREIEREAPVVSQILCKKPISSRVMNNLRNFRQTVPHPNIRRSAKVLRREGRAALLHAYPRLSRRRGKFEVHHRIPLEWVRRVFPQMDPNSLSNLQPLTTLEHRRKASDLWDAFRAAYRRLRRRPTQREVLCFAQLVDRSLKLPVYL
jgi:hypothetical protein